MTKIFFGFVRLFRNFFECLHSVPPSIFFLFCKRMDFQKLPKGPLLHFLALCDLPETKKYFEEKFQKNRELMRVL